MTYNTEIKKARSKIDKIDTALLKQFNARQNTSKLIGSIKKKYGAKIHDQKRINALKRKWKAQARKMNLDEKDALKLLYFLIEYSRKAQKRNRFQN